MTPDPERPAPLHAVPKLENYLLTFLFVATLATIMTGSIFNWTGSGESIASYEQRRISPKPKLNVANETDFEAFQREFQEFFNDRVAGRPFFVTGLSYLRYELLGTTNSKLVLIGKNQWLFYRATGGDEIARNAPLYSDGELNLFVTLLDARRAVLAKHGIKYLVFVVPSPSTIYPENLPDHFRVKNNSSRLDQLEAALQKNTRVDFVDLRPNVLQAKTSARIYYKTDTHWNSLGAFVGTQAVISDLHKHFSDIAPLKDDELKLVPFHFGDGDLARCLGLRDLIPEDTVQENPQASFAWHLSDEYKNYSFAEEMIWRKPYATVIDKSHLPRAFCLRDSYMVAQRPFLSSRFSRIDYFWTGAFPLSIIVREKPDVVIQEIAERFLAVPDYFSNGSEAYDALKEEHAGSAAGRAP